MEEKPQFKIKYGDKMQRVVSWNKGSVFLPCEERPCKENSCDAKEDKAEKGLPPLRCAAPPSFREMGSPTAAGTARVFLE